MTRMAAGRRVTIITWHYVRDNAPGELHARSIAEFEFQLDHIAAQFTPVTLQAVVAAAGEREARLPDNACLLTFDDGYRDHFETVFPRLSARGWQGVFFPVARAASDHRVLDVNKIQFAIARAGLETISQETRQAIDAARHDYGLPDAGTIHTELAVAGLHNPPEAMFVKRALQTRLPEALRTQICTELFARHVSADEQDFAQTLYADPAELAAMHAGGMALGGHGEGHNRMNALDPEARAREFTGSRDFLDSLGVSTGQGWSFCYPYGAFDEAAIAAARVAGCSSAFTLEPRTANLVSDDLLALPRIDTNDLPVAP